MALDALVDSTQLDSDLTSVANAIRTKGGTSAQLSFPAEFVSAIDAIPSGADYSVRTVTVSNNFPTVDRDFDNFIFIAQADKDEVPASAANVTAYAIVFVYVNGQFMPTKSTIWVSNGNDGYYNGSGQTGSNTTVGSTSIQFSAWTSQYMFQGTWHVLQIELPADSPLYSFTEVV